jgi:LCP family protein required for cell wall assembly
MPKEKKGKRKAPVFIVILIVIVLGGALWYYFANDNYEDLIPKRPQNDGILISETHLNILVIGLDITDSGQSGGRADAILVAGLDLENKRLNLLSIPRDTLIEIPEYYEDKINHAYFLGGAELLKISVEKLLNIPIDYCAATNFNGFKEVVDILGGVDIYVDKRMYYKTYDGVIDIPKGMQRLDGEKALQYVRFRHDPMGDITRVGRQRNFLKALFSEITSAENITALPRAIPKLMEYIETDLPMSKLLRLIKLIGDIDFANAQNASLPGNFTTIKGISYWQPNREETDALVRSFFSTETNAADSNGEVF